MTNPPHPPMTQNARETMNEPTVKPCPFCGKQPELSHNRSGYWLECYNPHCGLRGVYEHKRHAIANWNNRASQLVDERLA